MFLNGPKVQIESDRLFPLRSTLNLGFGFSEFPTHGTPLTHSIGVSGRQLPWTFLCSLRNDGTEPSVCDTMRGLQKYHVCEVRDQSNKTYLFVDDSG